MSNDSRADEDQNEGRKNKDDKITKATQRRHHVPLLQPQAGARKGRKIPPPPSLVLDAAKGIWAQALQVLQMQQTRSAEGEEMRIKFKQINETEVRIIGIQNDGSESEVGNIFSPSSSSHDNLDCIQICGFEEAFDLWGCAMYVHPSCDFSGAYVYVDGNKKMQFARDIQLKFHWETMRTDSRFDGLSNCSGCFNHPCNCEQREKYDNPFTVKREQDIAPYKKKEFQERQG